MEARNNKTINHIKTNKGGSFVWEENNVKRAEIIYLQSSENLMVIEHTEVDPTLKGKGIGKKLLGKLVNFVRQNQIKVIPLCPFAKATFERTPEWQDVLAHVRVKVKE